MRVLLAIAAAAVAAAASYAIVDRTGIAPRLFAPYLERGVGGHRPIVKRPEHELRGWLVMADRGQLAPHGAMPVPRIAVDAASMPRRIVVVSSTDDALRAIRDAEPGDAITFAPGIYRFAGKAIPVTRPGTGSDPIVVRAAVPGSAVLEFDMLEGFHVLAPYWTFEDLAIRGICRDHSACEHAFHVTGAAVHFTARRNRIIDFNAHFKINGDGLRYPDFGTLEGNVLMNDGVRDTGNPVTPIDLVAASHWRIIGNRISDFVKGQSDQVSYGAFVKGGGEDNRIERNVVVCEDRLRGAPGRRVGLSLGGGGSTERFCRDGRCIAEQERSSISFNLVVSCSDDGVYINRGATSVVRHNTLIDTAGIEARFGETSADVYGNLIDGIIRIRDGAAVHGEDNITTAAASLFVGWHPVRRLFVDSQALDFRWRGEPPRVTSSRDGSDDLCGTRRPLRPAYGAFEDVGACGSSAEHARMRSTSADVERR